MSVIDEIKNKAKANKKTVVLPETTDMRTLTAAAEVISEEIADIILVGKEDEIKAKAEGLDLSKASFVVASLIIAKAADSLSTTIFLKDTT